MLFLLLRGVLLLRGSASTKKRKRRPHGDRGKSAMVFPAAPRLKFGEGRGGGIEEKQEGEEGRRGGREGRRIEWMDKAGHWRDHPCKHDRRKSKCMTLTNREVFPLFRTHWVILICQQI